MGAVLGCLACNAATCVCSGIFGACSSVATGLIGRVGYTAIFFLVSAISWILRSYADQILHWVPVLQLCESEQCFGVLSIYRLCFPLAVFHLIHALLFIGANNLKDPRIAIQDGFWGFKLLILIAAIVGAFFIPNQFFEIFGWVALVGAGLFIIIQLLLLVDFTHSWAEKWITNYENTENETSFWWWALFGSSIFFYCGSIVLTVLMYVFFAKDAVTCDMNTGFITTNIVLAFIMTIVSIHPKIQEANPRSGLLQSAIICVYCTYLVWSALMSEPHDMGCNPFNASSSANNVSIIIGAIFTIIVVCYSTYSAAKTFGKEEHTPLLADEENSKKNEENEEEEEKVEKLEGPVAYNLSFFHLCFALGAMYIAMLMSDWFIVNKSNGDTVRVDTGMAAVWVKTVSSWVCCLLYIWTLIAPAVFPDRDWGYQTDRF